MKTELRILRAFHGDSLIIETFDSNNEKFIILVDGGPLQTFKTSLVKELSNFDKIDLIILTHIDDDHISGLIEYLNSSHSNNKEFCKIIINGGNLSKVSSGTQITYDQGITLEKLLRDKFKNIQIITDVVSDCNNKLLLPDGIDIKILSPNKETLNYLYKEWPTIDLSSTETTQICNENKKAKDFSIDFHELSNNKDITKTLGGDRYNYSSIAFSLRTKDFSGLFLGDANPDIVCDSIEKEKTLIPLIFDFVKLSHHGSKFNISNRLLNCFICNNYIVSTNGGKGRTKHPDRQTIAKIVKHQNNKDKKINIIFNYPLEHVEKITGKLFSTFELEQFNLTTQNLII